MKRFLIALQFLTILPIKIKSGFEEKDLGASLGYFPLVGFLIGVLLCAVLFVFAFLPNLVTSALILITSVVITGRIHLDGFADTCDGFYGSRPKEKMLEIMRDTRVGAMGVIGVATILLLKFALIASIPQGSLWKALILMATFARWSQVAACSFSDYARGEGKAKSFIEKSGGKELFLASLFTVAVFVILARFTGIILLGFSLLPVFLFISYVKKRIGGMTGDTVGATSEIAEVSVLFFALIYTTKCLY